MPIIGGNKTLSSLLHLSGSGSSKSDGRTAFSPYTGSLSGDGGRHNARGSTSQQEPEPSLSMSATMGFGSSITLNVRYVAKDMWRKVAFPPGITVTQARDICMLRFNVWQQTLASGVSFGASENKEQQASAGVGKSTIPSHAQGGAAMGFGEGKQSQKAQSELREQYGLFWTSAGHWLEPDEMLNAYPLHKAEVLELQHIVDFIPLQPHEFKLSYAEGHLYCLQTDGDKSHWQMCWAVLRCRVLRLYQQKGQQQAKTEIDLTRPFRLTDQDGRNWPRTSSSKNSSTVDIVGIQLLLEGLPSNPDGGCGTDGGVLVLQALAGSGSSAALSHSDAKSTHAFRTCSLFDYDVWHRTLRLSVSTGSNSGMTGGGTSMSGSASISGASNASNNGVPLSAQPSEMAVPGSSGYDGSNNTPSILSPQISQRLWPSSTRHEGYVNRKQPDGYGFRRRYCVLLSNALFGFLHADDCKDLSNADLISKCEFAVALAPSAVTIEAIAWNGRYLLRIFGSESQSLRDKPGATSLQPEEKVRTQCTDILATAAQSAIEQHGSTFGLLPDARELVRLMIEDNDEGQTWAVGFNSIAGLQITGHSKIIMSARRTNSLADSKSFANLKAGAGDFHTMPSPPGVAARDTNLGLDACEETSANSSAVVTSSGGQQSLNEFIVNQMDSTTGCSRQQEQQPPIQRQHESQTGLGIYQQPTPKQPEQDTESINGRPQEEAKAAPPKWIPLSIDKYVKQDEERKQHGASGYDIGTKHTGSRSSGGAQGLRSNPSNASDHDHEDDHGHGHNHSHHHYTDINIGHGNHRNPARFNWFKRRGSTSR
ncbi:hypothetical protein COEREDRAFT_80050 [Coemansia reversa NRRL 1564]|uniref:PH domain-containing protein n=1 Tax=Coemansia reversa (strain ATCC 12441 / NRRL 1564) TaxID=763665 RepID=A0A2G5BHB3_COERN|nr:hypothetical protein COEREDRAFT_80050 [Coemansia reversa NRRL 1564]|eukprot:PIA18117.1 hypothetical protein COEREDRAFT_80050 [Coemansia reversa NRRL 1564]